MRSRHWYRRWALVAALGILASASAGLTGCYGPHPYAHHRYESRCGVHSHRCDRPHHHKGHRRHQGDRRGGWR